MITINSKAKKVLVFKSIEGAPLRIFPGPNNIDVSSIEELASYFSGKAAQAMFSRYCKDITGKVFDMGFANDALAKNKKLNRSYKAIMSKSRLYTENALQYSKDDIERIVQEKLKKLLAAKAEKPKQTKKD